MASLEDYIFSTLHCSEDLTREYIKIVLSDIELFDRKQHDRGPENIARFGERGVLIRLADKQARLHKIVWDGVEPKVSEPVEQEWADTSVYGVIARLCRAGVWPGLVETPIEPASPPLPLRPIVGTRVHVTKSALTKYPVGLEGEITAILTVGKNHWAVSWDDALPPWYFEKIPGTTDGITVGLL